MALELEYKLKTVAWKPILWWLLAFAGERIVNKTLDSLEDDEEDEDQNSRDQEEKKEEPPKCNPEYQSCGNK